MANVTLYAKVRIVGRKSRIFKKYCDNASDNYVILKSYSRKKGYSSVGPEKDFTNVAVDILLDIDNYHINTKTTVDYKGLKHPEELFIDRLIQLGRRREQSEAKLKGIEAYLKK